MDPISIVELNLSDYDVELTGRRRSGDETRLRFAFRHVSDDILGRLTQAFEAQGRITVHFDRVTLSMTLTELECDAEGIISLGGIQLE